MTMDEKNDGVLTQYSSAPLDIEELLRMAEANPDNVNILDCLAFKFYTTEQLDKALELYGRIVKLQPENDSAHYYMGNIYYRKKRLVAAMMEWKKVISLSSDSKLAAKAQERIDASMQQVRDLK
jgi:tetratricopeptide (TPR) repeat protein